MEQKMIQLKDHRITELLNLKDITPEDIIGIMDGAPVLTYIEYNHIISKFEIDNNKCKVCESIIKKMKAARGDER
jgi:hypothetical protein